MTIDNSNLTCDIDACAYCDKCACTHDFDGCTPNHYQCPHLTIIHGK